jgi:type II pantothenate kinase
MIVGIDIGGSSTKAVAYEERIVGKTSVTTTDPYAAAAGALAKLFVEIKRSLKDVTCVALTGGGSHGMSSDLLGLRVERIDEMQAIGLGGIELTGEDEALVVSMGTGTAVLAVRRRGREINHVGGTGVGGGTLMGLSRSLLNKYEIGTLWKLAKGGDLSKVDLSVKEITGGAVGFLPEYATASNFGRVTDDASEHDLALGVVNMVGQVIGTIACLAARASGLEDSIVLVGKVAANPEITDIIQAVGELYGMKMVVPENPDYCTALGSAVAVRERNHA